MRKFYDSMIGGGGGEWQPLFGEWQVCPLCNGEGQLHNPTTTDNYTSITFTRTCDVCGGRKIIQKPIINNPSTE